MTRSTSWQNSWCGAEVRIDRAEEILQSGISDKIMSAPWRQEIVKGTIEWTNNKSTINIRFAQAQPQGGSHRLWRLRAALSPAGRRSARVWVGGKGSGPVKEKSVAGLDEDVITMSIEAARNALARAGIPAARDARRMGRLRSHPYAVKPTAHRGRSHRRHAPPAGRRPGNSPARPAARPWCMAFGLVGSGMAEYALAIGMDTAQGKPGDALEYTAASGGAAYIIGPAENALAELIATYSYVTDTPDFWRRAPEIS